MGKTTGVDYCPCGLQASRRCPFCGGPCCHGGLHTWGLIQVEEFVISYDYPFGGVTGCGACVAARMQEVGTTCLGTISGISSLFDRGVALAASRPLPDRGRPEVFMRPPMTPEDVRGWFRAYADRARARGLTGDPWWTYYNGAIERHQTLLHVASDGSLTSADGAPVEQHLITFAHNDRQLWESAAERLYPRVYDAPPPPPPPRVW